MAVPSHFPIDAEAVAALSRLSAEINGTHSPPPLAEPIVIDENGRVRLPVPDVNASDAIDALLGLATERKYISAELHAGITFQWAPMEPQGGLIIEFRGGVPDGDENRDAVAVFLTAQGLRGLARDLATIAAQLEGVA